MDNIIEQFQSYSAPNVFNPWRDIDRLDSLGMHAPQARISRLQAHFNCKPSFLLVGEAPGYQGCKFSGVPFTNEKLILDGAIPRVASRNRFTTRERPWCEPSATIVWRTLHKLGIAGDVVLWNAFPWHPHQPSDPYSNRTPSPAEITAGLQILEDIATHFHYATIVSVGRLAQHALSRLSRKCGAVRHPSMGGAKEFAVGLAAIVESKEVLANG